MANEVKGFWNVYTRTVFVGKSNSWLRLFRVELRNFIPPRGRNGVREGRFILLLLGEKWRNAEKQLNHPRRKNPRSLLHIRSRLAGKDLCNLDDRFLFYLLRLLLLPVTISGLNPERNENEQTDKLLPTALLLHRRLTRQAPGCRMWSKCASPPPYFPFPPFRVSE